MAIQRFLACIVLVAAQENREVLVKETVLDSAVADIVYLGRNHEFVLVTTKEKKLYHSKDYGQNWVMVADKVDSGDVKVERIILNAADKTVVVLQATRLSPVDNRRYPYIYVSENSGQDWRRAWGKKHGLHSWISHPKERTWALISWWSGDCDGSYGAGLNKQAESEDREPCVHKLMLTKDLGKTFTQLAAYVVQFSWGNDAVQQSSRVYFTAFRKKEGDQGKLSLWTKEVDFNFVDIDRRGRPVGSVIEALQHGNKFLISNEYILVAKVKSEQAQTVHLMVSNNGGKSFQPALLPGGLGELEERWYTVLDTSEGAVILHINSDAEGARDTGRVFVSDQEGYKFSQALVGNVRSSRGDCEFDKVVSLNGIYLANVVVPPGDRPQSLSEGKALAQEDLEQEASDGVAVERRHRAGKKAKEERIVRTVVSFDKGGAWKYLRPPKVDSLGKAYDCGGKPLEECQLNLHGTTSWDLFAPFYSSEACVGLIMGTGNVGNALRFEEDEVNTYLSRDGGLSWVEAHKGAYIYEYGDHGGLLVMANDMRATTQVVFSWNEGQAWFDFTVGSTPFEVDNIITEPNVTATTFVMFGTRSGGEGVLYYLQFDALKFPKCSGVWAADSVSSDYETWSPSDGSNSDACMLGQKVIYTRRKPTSQCWNGEEFERPVTKNTCACTATDFECDLGFTRAVGSTQCMFDGSLIPERLVPRPCLGSYALSPYRKVPGDQCSGGWMPGLEEVPCPSRPLLPAGSGRWLLYLSILVGVALAAYQNFLQKFSVPDVFSAGVDTSAHRGFVLATKELVVTLPGRFRKLLSGPGRGFEHHSTVSYSRVGGDYGLDETSDLGAFVDDERDDMAPRVYDSAVEEARFQREREDQDRSKMLSGGLEVAKQSVPQLPAPAKADIDEDLL